MTNNHVLNPISNIIIIGAIGTNTNSAGYVFNLYCFIYALSISNEIFPNFLLFLCYKFKFLSLINFS